MRPEELLGIATHHILDHLDEAPRVLLDIGGRITAALNRHLVQNFDPMTAHIWLADNERRHYRRPRNSDEPGETAGGRRGFVEEGHEDRLAAFGVLIEGNSDRLVAPQRLQNRSCGRMLTDNLDASSLANESDQRVAREIALSMVHEVDLKSMQSVPRREQLEIAEMSAQDQEPASRMASHHLAPVAEAIILNSPLQAPREKAPQPDDFRTATA